MHHLFWGLPDFSRDSRRGVHGLFWDSLTLGSSAHLTRKMPAITATCTREWHFFFYVSFPKQKPHRNWWKRVMLVERKRLDQIVILWSLHSFQNWRLSSQSTVQDNSHHCTSVFLSAAFSIGIVEHNRFLSLSSPRHICSPITTVCHKCMGDIEGHSNLWQQTQLENCDRMPRRCI